MNAAVWVRTCFASPIFCWMNWMDSIMDRTWSANVWESAGGGADANQLAGHLVNQEKGAGG